MPSPRRRGQGSKGVTFAAALDPALFHPGAKASSLKQKQVALTQKARKDAIRTITIGKTQLITAEDLPNQDLFVLIESFAALPENKVNEGDYDDAFLSLISVLEQFNKENNFITEFKDHIAIQSVIKSLVHRFGIERSNHLLAPVFGEEEAKDLESQMTVFDF